MVRTRHATELHASICSCWVEVVTQEAVQVAKELKES